ncbi:hypothetical protein BUALT_BualtUnG0021700 [Buddleja alternifolia]|uniref:Dynein light chain n=1 Tax=Buddleja alternifolia TaxID=168488 RepID=A0AAV6W061_9LAMI|nr:hypothetical protein BUALT_BualtUnG0021700 [Buddleja alternifolia]
MANHQTSHHHRRSLAPPNPPTPMDPILKKNPKPTPLSAAHHHPHPLPDPTISATIQNISHRFSKLYTNHKKHLITNPSKPHPHPQPESYFHGKPLSYSPLSDSSCATLTKSSSQHERNRTKNANLRQTEYYFSTKTKVKKKDSSSSIKNPSFDVKKASQLMSKSLDIENVKRSEEDGFEGRRSSVSSSIPQSMVGGGGGRRRSFCSSQVELADFLSCNGVKVVAVDMPPFMQIHAVDCARKVHDSLEKFTSKTLAFTLKKEFDGVYGPAWHCIVGSSFGSFVTHSVGGFMYFSMDHKLYVLLFKTTVQRAEGN